MKLIVGLGNPGDEYINTRHNVGFIMLDRMVKESFNFNKKFNSMEVISNINGEKIIFIKPLSYMNLSGVVVKKYIDYYNINLSDIFVIQDDMDLDVGKIKISYNRGDGGHNGIKNIISNIKSKEFYRLRVGIGKVSPDRKVDFVLGKFSNEEMKTITDILSLCNNIFEDFISLNRDKFLNKYNAL